MMVLVAPSVAWFFFVFNVRRSCFGCFEHAACFSALVVKLSMREDSVRVLECQLSAQSPVQSGKVDCPGSEPPGKHTSCSVKFSALSQRAIPFKNGMDLWHRHSFNQVEHGQVPNPRVYIWAPARGSRPGHDWLTHLFASWVGADSSNSAKHDLWKICWNEVCEFLFSLQTTQIFPRHEGGCSLAQRKRLLHRSLTRDSRQRADCCSPAELPAPLEAHCERPATRFNGDGAPGWVARWGCGGRGSADCHDGCHWDGVCFAYSRGQGCDVG